MIKVNSTPTVLRLLIIVLLAGCQMQEKKTFNVDDHKFTVPGRYLINVSIFYLPKEQHSGFMFVVNPDEPLGEQMTVLIESRVTTCSKNSKSRQLASACEQGGLAPVDFSDLSSGVVKVLQDGDPTQWFYVKRDKAGPRSQIIASCSGEPDGRNGLCTALVNYRDLVYLLSFPDDKVASLNSTTELVRSLLDRWKIK